jgi:hypothetical protein
MSKHPVNLAIRFTLEVIAIGSFGIWGFRFSDEWYSYVLALLFPLLFAGLWGVFAVPNDPSRSGKTVVRTPGLIRLILEVALFGTAAWMLFDLDFQKLGWIFSSVAFLHYVTSYDRIVWLLKQK